MNRSKLNSVKTWPNRMADWMGGNYIFDPSQRAEDERRERETQERWRQQKKAEQK